MGQAALISLDEMRASKQRDVRRQELHRRFDEWLDKLEAQLQSPNEAELGEALKQVKDAGVIPEDKVRLCVVGNGASWIGKHVESLFPKARQVLDAYPCAQSLHGVAKAHYGLSLQA